MSHEEDLVAVQHNGYALQYIKNQTPEMCLAAVKQDGRSLQFIKEQTPDKVNPNNPEHKPFYDLGWRDGDLGRICLTAVQQYGWALERVKEQTPEICLAAVKRNGRTLKYVKDLHSIANEIDQLIINEGLNSDDKEIVLACQKLVKIREANTISSRINKSVAELAIPKRKGIQL